MRLLSLKTSLFFILISLLLLSCAEKVNNSRVDALPYYHEATFTPHWSNAKDLPKNFHQIPDFYLTNQLGKTVSQKDLEGKIYIADFFFCTCPGICPKMTKNMKMIQDTFLLDQEVILLSHSVNPSNDSVEVLHRYAIQHRVDSSKWHLLTGNRDSIYRLGRNQYFIEEDLGIKKNADDFLHTENFVLIDKNKHIRGIFNGLNKASMVQLIADIRTLKKEN